MDFHSGRLCFRDTSSLTYANFEKEKELKWMIADIEGGKEAEGVSEQGVEENIWT